MGDVDDFEFELGPVSKEESDFRDELIRALFSPPPARKTAGNSTDDKYAAKKLAPRSEPFDGKTMPWGKYRGRPIDEVPPGYIGWIFERQMSGESMLSAEFGAALLCSLLRRLVAAVPQYRDVLKTFVGAAPQAQQTRRPIARPGDEF